MRARANRKSNPEAIRSRDWTYYLHKPECIVTTKPDRLVLIMFIIWHFNFTPWMLVFSTLKANTIFAYKREPFMCYSHYYVTRCYLNNRNCCLTMPIAKGHGAHDELTFTFNIIVFKSIKTNSTTTKHTIESRYNTVQYNMIFLQHCSDWDRT